MNKAAVVHLSYPICPSAVPGFIMSIVVDPVNTESWWAVSHVGKEGFEAITPPIAHLDSFEDIELRSFSFGVSSSFLNPSPDKMLFGSRKSMRFIPSNKHGSVIASAGGSNASDKIRCHGSLSPSTLASTDPSYLRMESGFMGGNVFNGKFPEDIAWIDRPGGQEHIHTISQEVRI